MNRKTLLDAFPNRGKVSDNIILTKSIGIIKLRMGTRSKGDEVVKKSIVATVIIALAGVIAGCGADTKSGEAQKIAR